MKYLFFCTGKIHLESRKSVIASNSRDLDLARSGSAGLAFIRVWTVAMITFLTVFLARADSKQIYLDALADFERYAETIWHDASGASSPTNAGYWGDGGSTGNGGIRGCCGVAVAYAVLVDALPNDPKTSLRFSRITKALNYVGQSHVTGNKICVDGHQWGWSTNSTEWQTPLWTGSMGLACILVQSNLPAQTISD